MHNYILIKYLKCNKFSLNLTTGQTGGGEGVDAISPGPFFYNSGKRIYSVILKRSVAVHPSLSRLSLATVSPCHLTLPKRPHFDTHVKPNFVVVFIEFFVFASYYLSTFCDMFYPP